MQKAYRSSHVFICSNKKFYKYLPKLTFMSGPSWYIVKYCDRTAKCKLSKTINCSSSAIHECLFQSQIHFDMIFMCTLYHKITEHWARTFLIQDRAMGFIWQHYFNAFNSVRSFQGNRVARTRNVHDQLSHLITALYKDCINQGKLL